MSRRVLLPEGWVGRRCGELALVLWVGIGGEECEICRIKLS